MSPTGTQGIGGAAPGRPSTALPTLVVPREVRERIEETLRGCGAHGWECVVFLTAALPAPDALPPAEREVLDFYHPEHGASRHQYTVPPEEVRRISEDLYRRRRQIVGQIHTHPIHAFHSERDDEGPMVHAPGYLSVVVPWFCRDGLAGLPGCYATVYQGGAEWRELSRDETLSTFRVE